jgi:hypothetical protein
MFWEDENLIYFLFQCYLMFLFLLLLLPVK